MYANGTKIKLIAQLDGGSCESQPLIALWMILIYLERRRMSSSRFIPSRRRMSAKKLKVGGKHLIHFHKFLMYIKGHHLSLP